MSSKCTDWYLRGWCALCVRINRWIEISYSEDVTCVFICFQITMLHRLGCTGSFKKSPVRMLRMVGLYLSLPSGGSVDGRRGIWCFEGDRSKAVVRALQTRVRNLGLPASLSLVCSCEDVLLPHWMNQTSLGRGFLLFHYSLSLEHSLASGSHLWCVLFEMLLAGLEEFLLGQRFPA